MRESDGDESVCRGKKSRGERRREKREKREKRTDRRRERERERVHSSFGGLMDNRCGGQDENIGQQDCSIL